MSERPGIGYIPALDGLRALAIIAILIFHYWPAGTGMLGGGFLGVEVFFVVSGYLITTLLLNEWRKKGSISLKNFWVRRSRRLLPAVIAMIVILILAASELPKIKEQLDLQGMSTVARYVPDLSGELARMKEQVLAAASYSSNWYFIFSGGSYFESTERPPLFEHLWSLAIEEQFYLLWPILIIVMLRFFKSREKPIFVSILFIAFLSAISLWVNGKAAPLDTRAYFGTDSRAYALMLGAALAVVWKPGLASEKPSGIKKVFPDLIGIAGLSAIGYLCWNLVGGELFIFRGGLFLASLATIAVIISGTCENSMVVRPLLSSGISRWIGKRSYGIYLWHWPIFVLTEPAYVYSLEGWPLLMLRAFTLLTIVEFSYHFIENPIRNGAIGKYFQEMREAKGRYRLATICQFGLAIYLSTTVVISCTASMMLARPGHAHGLESNIESVKSRQIVQAANQDVYPKHEQKKIMVAEKSEDGDDDEVIADIEEENDGSNVQETVKNEEENEEAILRGQGKIIALGDSVMLGARRDLEKSIGDIQVDAVVSRQFTEVAKIVASLKRNGKLPQYVVVHTGTNGTIDEKRFIEMMDMLRDCKRVVVCNLRVPRVWQEQNNQIIARVVPQYANAVLVDWNRESSAKKEEVFYRDGIHLKSPKAARFYVSLIKKALVQT